MLQEDNGPIGTNLLEGLSTPLSADVLVDLPGVLTMARVYYEAHTEYETTYNPLNLEPGDMDAALSHVPLGAMFLGHSVVEIAGETFAMMRFCSNTAIADKTADVPQSVAQEIKAARESAQRYKRAAFSSLLVVTNVYLFLALFFHLHDRVRALVAALTG